MKIKRKDKGGYDIIPTLNTMNTGDTWKIWPCEVNLRYLRVACCLTCKATNKKFTVSVKDTPGKYTITRTK